MTRLLRWMTVLMAPLLLTGCLLSPGKFTSTLDITRDGRFTFTYAGEVEIIDSETFSRQMKGTADAPEEEESEGKKKGKDDAVEAAAEATDEENLTPEQVDAKRREWAAELMKEQGYRSVVYKGNDVFEIDYAISGRTDHSFVFPYNFDAEVLFPFIAMERRANGTVRAKAMGFGDNSSSAMEAAKGGAGADSAGKLTPNGIFTLTTDAEVVSQNNENGVTRENGKTVIRWTVRGQPKDAPTVVLRLQP